jgi:5-methylcytosine-specific restriction endonuclease McrBC regulatory subunit McrC
LTLAATRTRSPLLCSAATGAKVLNLRPDYLFVSQNSLQEKRLVGDAKWKRLDEKKSSFDLSPSDVYQLTTYMAFHGLDRGILLFPADKWMPRSDDAWMHRFNLLDSAGNKRITLVGVDIAELVSQDPARREQGADRLKRALLKCI